MQLRTEVQIDATPERVWDVLADFAAYPEWNRFIVAVSGSLEKGARLEVTLSPPDGSEMTFRPVLLGVDPARELRWRGVFGFSWLFSGEHFFLLQPRAGGTQFVHGEDFSGILLRALGGTLTKTARGFVFMNQALKRRCEGAGG